MSIETPSYADRTINSKNPLQRYAHRRRFKKSVKLINLREDEKLLDYGCGDGMLLAMLTSIYKEHKFLYGYEPYMPLEKPLRLKIFRNIKKLRSEVAPFDIITCFEVLEHFNTKGQYGLIQDFLSLLTRNGRIIISVPIEIYAPSLVKNLNRIFTINGPIYSAKNMFYSCIGKTSKLEAYRSQDGYLSHMGFDHRKLEELFKQYCDIEHKSFSPFLPLGSMFNSQVFYIYKRKPNIPTHHFL